MLVKKILRGVEFDVYNTDYSYELEETDSRFEQFNEWSLKKYRALDNYRKEHNKHFIDKMTCVDCYNMYYELLENDTVLDPSIRETLLTLVARCADYDKEFHVELNYSNIAVYNGEIILRDVILFYGIPKTNELLPELYEGGYS